MSLLFFFLHLSQRLALSLCCLALFPSTKVALYGPGGLLAGESEFSFAGGTLSVPSLNVQSIDSNGVDFMGSPLTNVRVQSGSLSGLSAVKYTRTFCTRNIQHLAAQNSMKQYKPT